MKIVISGSTGFIGRKLIQKFRQRSWEFETILRDDFKDDERLLAKIDGADVVIHLAGAPIVKRWTRAHKKEISGSRLTTTRKIAGAIRKARQRPSLLISNSAIGILKSDKIYTEANAVFDQGFIGELCQQWEKEALAVSDLTRVVVFRLAVVLDRDEGALRKMLWAFRLGLGGRIGTGKQLFSWIHRDDLIRAYSFVMEQPSVRGVVHVASPETVTNASYTKILGTVIRRPVILPIPVFLLRMLYGKAATTLSTGQGAMPERLLQAGFRFHYSSLEEALRHLLT